MGTKYSTTSVASYNASPPSDDGSATAANQVFWSTIKTKLGDPLNTFAAAIDPKITTALDTSVRQITTSDSSVAGDHWKTIVIASTVSTGITLSLGDAATMAAGYIVTVNNQSAVAQTIGRVTSANGINGTVGNITIGALQAMTFKVNSGLTGYVVDGLPTDEGPWTPTLVGTGGGPLTYTTQLGRYVRQGNLVWISCTVVIAGGAGITGPVSVSGLPFPASTITNYIASMAVGNWVLTLDAGYTQVVAIISSGTSTIALQENGSTKAVASPPAASVGAGVVIEISGTYRIN